MKSPPRIGSVSTRLFASDRFAFWFVAAMLLMISIPVAVTCHTIRSSAYRPLAEVIGTDPSPHGYTVSLLIFVVPVCLILFWFSQSGRIRIARRACWGTRVFLFPWGAGWDCFFAQYFFTFPNPAATAGIAAPALGIRLPIEEYAFYFMGFLAVLLLYLWLDGYWLRLYSVPDDDQRRASFRRLAGFHPDSLILAAGLIALAIFYKERLASPQSPGFPGYLTFLILGSFLPAMILYPAVKNMINWRALSLTVFVLALTSLLWEATLAIPYGWWGYQDKQMMGLRVRAWHDLPIEAVFVWVAVSYVTVIVFEAIRCWQASGKPAREAFMGRKRREHPVVPK